MLVILQFHVGIKPGLHLEATTIIDLEREREREWMSTLVVGVHYLR